MRLHPEQVRDSERICIELADFPRKLISRKEVITQCQDHAEQPDVPDGGRRGARREGDADAVKQTLAKVRKRKRRKQRSGDLRKGG